MKTRVSASIPITLIATMALTVSGCMHIEVGDKQFLRPDSATGYQSSARVTLADLQKVNSAVSINEISITSTGQTKLEGLSFQLPGSQVSVLYFGGNLSHVDNSIPYALANLGRCNINLTTVDYRGYGRTAGVPDTPTLQQDALAVYDAVRAKTSGKLVVHGHSLGSFIAGYIAQQRQPDGIILETTASTVEEVVAASTPWYALPFVRFSFQPGILSVDNVKAMSSYTGPALVITAEKDVQTPAALGKKVFDAIPSKNKKHLFIKDAGHSGLLRREDVQQAYCEYIRDVARQAD
ncbi:alpha/beta fold hydrolase [Undibacterium sp. CY7W]|uniref:Alpha/beta fold hydrolase n=1 Tax=Undibacterium rugosum TaxID=2762291 RepID=A0A923I156_9BURK|nr:alpha/beta fold hydrolase [Undibacterium rugosum]MBC3934465.1 alpha/beta fold hydrolase [Undibacterium rugosum]